MNKVNDRPGYGVPVLSFDEHTEKLQDPRRLDALDRADVMDTRTEEAFDRVVRLATQIIGTPVGLVSFVDGTRQFFKAHTGLSDSLAAKAETPLSHSFCQYVVSTDAPLLVEDARNHPILGENPAIVDMNVVAYLGVPIHSPEGETLGSLCAIDGKARDWSQRDLDLLSDLTVMLETELRLRRERDAIKLLAHELNHRVKNLFTVMSGMISMTARSTDTSSEMAEALQGRLSALSWAHDLIAPAVIADDAMEMSIDLETLVTRLLAPHASSGRGTVDVDVPDLNLTGRNVADMALVIHELATNAAKYGALSVAGGRLSVTATCEDGAVELIWDESGGPEIMTPPVERGFGSKLIKLTLGTQMAGALETDWRRTGVRHVLRLPTTVFADS